MPSEFRPIRGLLKNSAIHPLLNAAHAQNELLTTIRRLLPESLATHCVAAVQSEQGVVLFANTPAWASRIRYLSRNIKQKLRKKGLYVKEIRVRVYIENRRRAPGHAHPRQALISPRTAALIASLAEGMTNPEIKTILLNISKRARNGR